LRCNAYCAVCLSDSLTGFQRAVRTVN
jgi:hypothetical protein